MVTDSQVHDLLDKHTVSEAQALQKSLAVIRANNGHYKGDLTTLATIELLNMAELVNKNALILADKEPFTEYLIRSIEQNSDFEFLVPAISIERIQKIERSQSYQRKWAGYAVAETDLFFS